MEAQGKQRGVGVKATRRGPARFVSDESTRERVIRAAIDCVLEEGYYRASSNRIAKRAGLTWGVIQHYFGTRDHLLIEVARSIIDKQLGLLKEAVIEGPTVEARLHSFADHMWEYFGTPEYLVCVQIVLNLSRDPIAADETTDTIAELSERIAMHWRPLLEAAIGLRLAKSKIGSAVADSLRGLAIGQALTAAFPAVPAHTIVPPNDVSREHLVRALALLVDAGSESVASKPSARRTR